MSERIERGDLVMVVRGPKCCGDVSEIGKTFMVSWVGRVVGECGICGAYPGENMAADASINGEFGYPFYMLKKLPPLTEPTQATMKEVA